ncbi:MAG: nitric oxide reductase activation protein NorD [Candidatus Binatia bacterium]
MLSRLADTDRQRLTTVLSQLSPPAGKTLQEILSAAATFDPRPLPGVLALLGPTLHMLPPDSCLAVLERIARLADIFPEGVMPLFRALSKVYDEGGVEGTLAWVTAGEAIALRNTEAGVAFFSLRSRTSLLALRGASSAVYLHDIQGILLKYLHMLSQAAVVLTETERVTFPPPLAEDGMMIPLPFCCDEFPTYEENFRVYRVLVTLHAGRVEYGTYRNALPDLWPVLLPLACPLLGTEVPCPENIQHYFQLFPRPDLIEAVFLGIEDKRISAPLRILYPGVRTDLAWAESLTFASQPDLAGIFSRLPESVWAQLEKEGTVGHSLVLATRIYAEFLKSTAKIEGGAHPIPGVSDEEFSEADMAGFLTGVELEGGEASSLPAQGTVTDRRRRALAVADLRYLYDEWDSEIEDYRPHWCELREVALLSDHGAFFSATVTKHRDLVQEVKREFQRLRPRMYKQVKGLEDGEEIDLNAVVNAHIDRHRGHSPSPKLYSARELIERDVAVLFLVDVSASTAALPDEPAPRISPLKGQVQSAIDLMKEALVVLASALEEIGDAYAIYGFSSNGRFDVEVYPVKTFRDSLSAEVQGNIGGLTPKGGTRMGAAVRHATRRLKNMSSRTKLLVLLSDGYPEDAGYGKPVIPPTYGLRDTRMALSEAERSGILSFCLTIDKGGRDYLREMCPSARYLVIDDVLSLPRELPKIYQRYIRVQN